jgi:hypothetical protein
MVHYKVLILIVNVGPLRLLESTSVAPINDPDSPVRTAVARGYDVSDYIYAYAW